MVAKTIILLLAIGLGVFCSDKVTAELLIITYQPLYLNLTFSEQVTLPKFQLLFNEIPIQYNVVCNSTQIKSSYLMEGNTDNSVNPGDYIIEKYVLIFSEPLLAAGGNLDLGSFVLRARPSRNQTEYILLPISEKDSHYYYQNEINSLNSLGIVMVVITYFLALTTVIGINAYHFLAIYCFISLQSPLFTSLDYRLAFFLLFEVHQAGQSQSAQFVYLMIPFMVIGVSFVLGLISRVALKKISKRSGFWNQTYYFFSYKLFITCWQIMVIPIFANIVHLLQDLDHFSVIPQTNVILYIYFGMAVTVLYSYMAFFTMNPQCKQNYNDWIKYVDDSEKGHFLMFQGFHPCIDPHDWKKRNYNFFRSIKKLLIMIFVGLSVIQVPNLLFQIVHLIYLFTIRPFKYDFFNYSNIAMQVVVVLFYLYNYIVQLYTGISDEVTTSTDITHILLSNIILLCVIVFVYFLLGIYEFYERLKFFKINLQFFNKKMNKLEASKNHKITIFNPKEKEIGTSFTEKSRNQKSERRRGHKQKKTKPENPDKIILEEEMTERKIHKDRPTKKAKGKESLLHNMANEYSD